MADPADHQKCPDGGYCHHGCKANECFRVACCEPLSGVYEDNQWPDDIRIQHTGRYIHERTEKRPGGTRVMRQVVDGVEQVWVHASDFMDVQKERDDARRQLALINAWRWSSALEREDLRVLDQQLEAAGLTRELGLAMLGLIAEVQSGALRG